MTDCPTLHFDTNSSKGTALLLLFCMYSLSRTVWQDSLKWKNYHTRHGNLPCTFLLPATKNESVFSGVRVTRSLVLYVCFVDRCLSFCLFSFGHCVVCSSIYGFWLINPLVSSNPSYYIEQTDKSKKKIIIMQSLHLICCMYKTNISEW